MKIILTPPVSPKISKQIRNYVEKLIVTYTYAWVISQLILNLYKLFQVAVHLVAPTRQEKAAWITDIAQVS